MALYTFRTSDLAALLTGAVTVGILASMTVVLAFEGKPTEVKPAEVITEQAPADNGQDCTAAMVEGDMCGGGVRLDAYTRCLLAMDAAELSPLLCEPVNDPDPTPSPSR